jgi:hypothetical protein
MHIHLGTIDQFVAFNASHNQFVAYQLVARQFVARRHCEQLVAYTGVGKGDK